MPANMKAIKQRIKSVENTMQITKAMELVASSKMRKAKERADSCRPYFRELHRTLCDIACGNTDFSSVYARESSVAKTCYVVIAGDRGLAGGYNNNLFKAYEQDAAGKDCVVLPVGKKTVEYFNQHHVPCLTEEFAEIASLSVADCYEMARLLCKEYAGGTFGRIVLCHTEFVSMLSQRPQVTPILPLTDLDQTPEEEKVPVRDLILYEPDSSEVFDAIVPEYVGGLLYGGVCDSVASELAARRMAMESATNNAEDMIESLNLYYNRARQSSITQEITEIVGGAEYV